MTLSPTNESNPVEVDNAPIDNGGHKDMGLNLWVSDLIKKKYGIIIKFNNVKFQEGRMKYGI